MKILKESTKKKIIVKWILYLISIYLLSSWGVNRIVNPLVYIRSTLMQKKSLRVSDHGGDIHIELQDADYLSFQIAESNEYSYDLQIIGYLTDGMAEEKEIRVFKGWNTIDLKKLQGSVKKEGAKGYERWKEIVVQKEIVEQKGLRLEDIKLSEYPYADLFRMLSVYLSFLILVIFWEGICWIKRKYAQ